jgi:UDP-2,3-diacylglucosamine pyrophosphatase LpxH
MDLSTLDITTIPDIKPGKGMAASDIHLGLAGSHGDETLYEMTQQIRLDHPSLIVLNGDIIEAEKIGGNISAKKRILRENISKIRHLVEIAIEQNPDCRIAYIFGNHDDYIELAEMLDQLRNDFPKNFSLHSAYLKVGEKELCTHGDLVLHGMNARTGKPADSKLRMASSLLSMNWAIAGGNLERAHSDKEHPDGWKHLQPSKAVNPRKAVHDHGPHKLSRTVFRGVKAGSIDQKIGAVFYDMKLVIPALVDTLKQYPEHDRVTGMLIGHIHSPQDTGATMAVGDRTLECRVTGPSTQHSYTTLLRFDVAPETLVFSNFKNFSYRKVAHSEQRTPSALKSLFSGRTIG